MERPTLYSRLNTAMLTIAAIGGIHFSDETPERVIPEKPCLNCGKMKQHNNSFCSADCCKSWKAKKNT